MQPDQSYAKHRRWQPPLHFFIVPVLTLNVLVHIYELYKYRQLMVVWSLIVAIAMALLPLFVRLNPLRAQDRIIRLEERLRLERILPADLRPHAANLRTSQLIALRFAEDDEVADLVRAIAAGEVTTTDDIKRRIRVWRPDYLRV